MTFKIKIHISPLDKLCSLLVRGLANWTCERCGAKHQKGSQGLHCSHFHGRAKKSVRWDLRNLNALCFGCHAYFTAHPEAHRAWKIKQMGENEYKKLDIDAQIPGKTPLIFIKKYLEQMLKEHGLI